jgi:hypothetical protein
VRFKATIDSQLVDHARAARARIDDRVSAGLDELGHQWVAAAGQIAGGTGDYRQSFTSVNSGRAVEVGSTSPLAHVIEAGRRPGKRPPVRRRRSGDRYGVTPAAAEKIARSGTRGRFVVKRTAAKIRNGTLQRITSSTMRDVLGGR